MDSLFGFDKTLFNINVLNENKYLAGIGMILFNLGSKYLIVDLNKNTDNLLKSKIMRRITLFSIFFISTRDVIASLMLTVIFLILTIGLFNEDSKMCIIPSSFTDDIYTKEEYDIAKKIITEYEKIHKITYSNSFCKDSEYIKK